MEHKHERASMIFRSFYFSALIHQMGFVIELFVASAFHSMYILRRWFTYIHHLLPLPL